MTRINLKIEAAKAAINYIQKNFSQDNLVLGIGTGSTIDCLLELLPSIRHKISYTVSSSNHSTATLENMGFDVRPLTQELDIYIDGADEVTLQGTLIKGGGGALVREKILASAAKKFICIVDHTKVKSTLGAFSVAIETLPLSQHIVKAKIEMMAPGVKVSIRPNPSDNSNTLMDARGLDLSDPLTLETSLNCLAGVLDNGIFSIHKAHTIICASDNHHLEIIEVY